MTDQEINIAIAECCGWRVKLTHPESKYAPWSLIAPSGNTIVDCADENDGWNQTHRYPNYTSDLNAMHDAEKVFDNQPVDTKSLYWDYLCLCSMPDPFPGDDTFLRDYVMIRSTARQRSEAFLRTLGKWKE